MITNSKLTVYHNNGLDISERTTVWVRHNYNNVWFFGGKGASTNKGYDNANDVDIRIPYDKNDNLNIENFAIGDILVQGELDINITTQQDLETYQVYNITLLNNDTFGKNPHIRIGGK